MLPFSWRQWWISLAQSAPVRRKPAAQSTRLMEVELLENRWLPAPVTPSNILVGTVAHGKFTPNFNDGAVSATLTVFGADVVAPNLRSAVNDVNNDAFVNKTDNIMLQTTTNVATTNKLTPTFGGQLVIDPTSASTVTIKNVTKVLTNYSTIDAGGNSRIFLIDDTGANITLDHLQLQNGMATSKSSDGAAGGAIVNFNEDGSLTLSYDKIVNNKAAGASGAEGSSAQMAFGGGVYNSYGGTLTIINSTFSGNIAQGGDSYGGGSIGAGTHTGAGAEGGGLYLAGGQLGAGVSITASTFNNNQAIGGNGKNTQGGTAYGGFAYGGAIQAGSNGDGASLTIINSTFAKNDATGGTGVVTDRSDVTRHNSITGTSIHINNNSGHAFGGAISDSEEGGYSGYGGVNLVNDTIAQNQVFGAEGNPNHGAGVANLNASQNTVNVVNTIIAENTTTTQDLTNDPDDVGGLDPGSTGDVFFQSFGHNFIGADNGTNDSFTAIGDQVGSLVGLNLGNLANNGGPTQTMALLKGSKCINRGDDTFGDLVGTPLTDQRGSPRISSFIVDIGAFEYQAPVVTSLGRDLLYDIFNAHPTSPPPP